MTTARLSWMLLLASGMIGLAGCGRIGGSRNSAPALSASCRATPDQRPSFMAKVEGFPIQIQADSAFTPWQRGGIASAAREWNALGRRLVGADFFSVTYIEVPTGLRDTDARKCNDVTFGSARTLPLLREESIERWKGHGFKGNNPGGTMRCSSDGIIAQQMVAIYINIINDSQFASVVTHELGHALGLNHSCDDGDDAEVRYGSCDGLSEDHPYRKSVMFPSLGIRQNGGGFEAKEHLTENDIMRTECLYGR